MMIFYLPAEYYYYCSYGVVTRRLPTAPAYTEYGIYYRVIPYRVLRTDCSISIVRKAKADILLRTTRQEGGEYVRLHHDWPGWRIEYEWLLSLGLVWFHFPRAPISEQSREGGKDEVTREVGGRKVKSEKKKKEKKKIFSWIPERGWNFHGATKRRVPAKASVCC